MRYLIVGQGLVGTLLAHRLEDQGIDFNIIDSGKNESSIMAAGIINPIVFRRVTKSWLVDECLNELVPYYSYLENKLSCTFLFKRTLRRAFSSEQEVDFWVKKSATSDYNNYLAAPNLTAKTLNYITDPFGNSIVNNAYYVDTKQFIDTNRAYFRAKGVLLEKEFDYLSISDEACEIDSIKFDRIVFCEGYRGKYNPYFSYLPLTATKGQIVEVKVDGKIPKGEILNRKCFLLQTEDNSFKAGATYEWDSPNTQITEEAKLDLSSKISNLIPFPFSILNQHAGVRPTTIDRRPLMGVHPEHSNLFIFNGLGAKGYMLAPLLTKMMVEFLINGKELPLEMKISRFK